MSKPGTGQYRDLAADPLSGTQPDHNTNVTLVAATECSAPCTVQAKHWTRSSPHRALAADTEHSTRRIPYR